MACIRKRRGKWVVDYRDATGRRRWVTCRTKGQAEAVLGEALRAAPQRMRPLVDPRITVAEYAMHWLELVAPTLKPRSLQAYEGLLRVHILPALGAERLVRLARGTIREFLAGKLKAGLARGTVRGLHAVLRALLSAAIEDGLLVGNPAGKLGRMLRLQPSKEARREEVKALTREQLTRLLQATERQYAPVFLTLARAGLRVGEAVGLQWADVDLDAREARVVRAISEGQLGTPKSGHGRSVELSADLVRALQALQVARKAEALRRGWKAVPPWVFCSGKGTPLARTELGKAFKRALVRAGLPPHLTPHCLRHTYASLLLQRGVSPVYVQRQLGHASIQLTVDTYGRWLPMGDKAAVDGLDESAGGSGAVAGSRQGGETP